MFERYTESARRVLFFSRYEASQFGAHTIQTEHLLLGLTREAKGVTCEIFALSHVSLKGIRQEIESGALSREKTSTSEEIPFSAEAQRVLLFSAEEADRLGHAYIGTEHLLLGLLREGTSAAASTLTRHGLRLDDVRRDIVNLLADPSVSSGSSNRSVELAEHVDRLKRLVEDLARTQAGDAAARELLERILRDLDVLKRRFAD